MGVMMTLADLFFLPLNKRGLPAMALMMGLMAAIVAAVIIFLS